MLNYLKSDFLKQKHKFSLKLLWIAPIIPILLSLLLMGGMFFKEGSFNWWYTLILPATISMIVSLGTSAEKKYNRHGLYCACANKKKLWHSNILLYTILTLILNLVFFLLILFVSLFLGIEIYITTTFFACITLFLTFVWQIPVYMFLAEKTGKFITIFIALICNMAFGIFLAPTKLWFVPFAIPSRLMCAIVGVMPNGLPVQTGSLLADNSVVAIGILITSALYFIMSFLTALWFNKSEVQ